MAKVEIPVESGNDAIKSEALPKVIQQFAERWKPESMYFTAFDGVRTVFLVFDMSDSSDLPPFAEPFFRELNAKVEIAPTMNVNDMQKGLSQLG
jgi:hypothetical protein